MQRHKNPFGIRRIRSALGYSLDGLHHAITKEPAFQQQCLLSAIMTLIAICAPFPPFLKIALVMTHLLVLIVELINTAIEATIDKLSPDYDPLAKHAKDLASAAVLLALIMASIVWGYAIYTYLY